MTGQLSSPETVQEASVSMDSQKSTERWRTPSMRTSNATLNKNQKMIEVNKYHHLHEDKNYSSYCIAINNKIAMGSANSDITQNEFNKAWKVSDRFDHLTVWENKDNPNHQLEEYLVQDYDDPLTQRLYRLRRNSPYLVNAYSLKKDGFGFCETTHESSNLSLI